MRICPFIQSKEFLTKLDYELVRDVSEGGFADLIFHHYILHDDGCSPHYKCEAYNILTESGAPAGQ